MSLSLIFLSAGYRRSTEVDSKPVTASLSLPNARLSDTSVDRVTIDSPRDGEREGSQEALHSPTTGQLKTVSVASTVEPLPYPWVHTEVLESLYGCCRHGTELILSQLEHQEL